MNFIFCKFWARSEKLFSAWGIGSSGTRLLTLRLLKIEVGSLLIGALRITCDFKNRCTYAASWFIGVLRVARIFKESACYLLGFWFLFPKSPRFWNLKLEYFPIEKVFADFPNRGTFIYSYLLMTKFSARLNFFFPKIPPIFNLKLDFFPFRIFPDFFFQNTQHFFYLNYISVKKKK